MVVDVPPVRSEPEFGLNSLVVGPPRTDTGAVLIVHGEQEAAIEMLVHLLNFLFVDDIGFLHPVKLRR